MGMEMNHLGELGGGFAAGEEMLEAAFEVLIAEAGARGDARMHQRLVHALPRFLLDFLWDGSANKW